MKDKLDPLILNDWRLAVESYGSHGAPIALSGTCYGRIDPKLNYGPGREIFISGALHEKIRKLKLKGFAAVNEVVHSVEEENRGPAAVPRSAGGAEKEEYLGELGPADEEDQDLLEWHAASRKAVESVLGKADDRDYHALIFFEAGAEHGGAPDVLKFSGRVGGDAYVTCDLIGRDSQVRSRALGNYEVMICLPKGFESRWATSTLTALSYYTLKAKLEPGQTCDIGETPKGSSLAGFLFSEYARFEINGRPCGLLVCVGITEAELRFCHEKPGFLVRDRGPARLEARLKAAGVYPVTDFYRQSLV